MWMRTLGLAIGLLVAASSAQAQQPSEVDKASWIEHMRTNAPAALCDDSNGVFRACFKVSEQRCKVVAAVALDGCIKKTESALPGVIHLPDEGREWGEHIGQCTGAAYEQMLLSEKINSPQCK